MGVYRGRFGSACFNARRIYLGVSFSAAPSFTTVGVRARIGAAILGKRPSRRETPLTSLTLLFAIQVSVEGVFYGLICQGRRRNQPKYYRLLRSLSPSPKSSGRAAKNSIRYFNDFPYRTPHKPLCMSFSYIALLPSSYRTHQTFGALVFLGYSRSLYLFISTLILVWRFFAAVASGVLCFYFSSSR